MDPIEAPGGARDFAEAFALMAEMTQQFANTRDIEIALENALRMIVKQVAAEAGSLWLVADETDELVCSASVGVKSIRGMRLRRDQGIVGRSVCENVAQQVLDVTQDPRFDPSVDAASGFRSRSILCAPMHFSNQVLGAVEVVNKRGGDGCFSPEDVHPLKVLASSAALAISNARMTAAYADTERVRRELELAAEIQRGLLPSRRPPPFPVHGHNVPARTISGDFFDVLPLEDGQIAFCLGDVAGKGMNAAMMMAKTVSLFRCLAKSVPSPGALLSKLNAEICETSRRGMFVTMAAGVLSKGVGSVRLSNAGHEPPLLRAPDGAFSSFRAEAPPLGILGEVEYPEVELELCGGALYLCSDGITEARVPEGGELGVEGLKKLIDRFASVPLGERIDAIVSEVCKLELRDDVTILAVCDETDPQTI